MHIGLCEQAAHALVCAGHAAGLDIQLVGNGRVHTVGIIVVNAAETERVVEIPRGAEREHAVYVLIQEEGLVAAVVILSVFLQDINTGERPYVDIFRIVPALRVAAGSGIHRVLKGLIVSADIFHLGAAGVLRRLYNNGLHLRGHKARRFAAVA